MPAAAVFKIFVHQLGVAPQLLRLVQFTTKDQEMKTRTLTNLVPCLVIHCQSSSCSLPLSIAQISPRVACTTISLVSHLNAIHCLLAFDFDLSRDLS